MPNIEGAAVSVKTKGEGRFAGYWVEQFGLDAQMAGQQSETGYFIDSDKFHINIWLIRLTHDSTEARYELVWSKGENKFQAILAFTGVPFLEHFNEGLLILQALGLINASLENAGHQYGRMGIYDLCIKAIDKMLEADPNQKSRKVLNITKMATYLFKGQVGTRTRLYYYFKIYPGLKQLVEQYFDSAKVSKING